jgi:hypothetical protein
VWNNEFRVAVIYSSRETGLRPRIEVLIDSVHGYPGILAKRPSGKAGGSQGDRSFSNAVD